MEPITRIEGTAVPLDRSDVDTDQIIPAQYLKRIERTGFGPFLFDEWRKDPSFVLNDPRYDGASILIAGANFGCGSSREHAPWALEDHGFRAVIAPSFADIFRNNSLKNGLLPIDVSPERHAALFELVAADPDAELTVDLQAQQVRVHPTTGGADEAFGFEVDPFARRMLLEGTDEIGYVLARLPAIEAWEAANPARVNTLA